MSCTAADAPQVDVNQQHAVNHAVYGRDGLPNPQGKLQEALHRMRTWHGGGACCRRTRVCLLLPHRQSLHCYRCSILGEIQLRHEILIQRPHRRHIILRITAHAHPGFRLLLFNLTSDAFQKARLLREHPSEQHSKHVAYTLWCAWVCTVLGGCRWGVAGCCVLCFLFCACVPLLTVRMLCSSYLCSGFYCATPDAYSALCLVLHCAAPLDVSKSLTVVHTPKHLHACQ